MAFPPKLGCPLCSIVSTASHTTPSSPRSPSFPPGSTQPEVLWRDDNFTAYREKANPVSSAGHIIIAFNLHVPSIYTLSSSDLPLLVTVKSLGTRLLSNLLPDHGGDQSMPNAISGSPNPLFQIGFITPPFKDSKIPVTDHLHAHAYIMPADLMGWWRSIGYGPLAWYAIDDLIAEIRESVSNNRVKSGYENRTMAPIDTVPGAGARSGTADGIEIPQSSIGVSELGEVEEGQGRTSTNLLPLTPTIQSPVPRQRI